MLLESQNEARRGGAFLCQLSEVDQRRPLGVLTNVPGLWQFLQLGWPSFSLSDKNLVYTGPLPKSCPCKQQHEVMKGTLSVDQFYASRASTFGPLLWSRCFENIMVRSLQQALRDGCVSHVQSGSPVALPSVPVVTASLASSQCGTERTSVGCLVVCREGVSWKLCRVKMLVGISQREKPEIWTIAWQIGYRQVFALCRCQRSLANRLPHCCLSRILCEQHTSHVTFSR